MYLVQLGQTLRSCGSTSLDWSGSETNDKVCDGNMFGLSGAVRNHDTPASGEGVLCGLDRLSEGTDLVDLEQKGVAGLELNRLLDAKWVGHRQVVTITSVSM